MNDNIILKQVVKIIAPCIQMFGLYVIIHGHISPGGGFAGGTILASSYILLYFTYGKEYVEKTISYKNALTFICCSLALYGVIKGYSFLSQGTHLWHPSTGVPGEIFSGGFILPLNILVGIIVTYVMYVIFSLFAEEQ